MRATPQDAAGTLLVNASPLLEEERNPRGLALFLDRKHPFLFHRPSTGTAFPTDDHPRYPLERDRPEIFERRFNRQESNCRPALP